ncbi:MAG: hypothetical protein ACP5M5_14210, partial [Acidibrevibacterium sp.]|uniref:hypothetical protein n=1 Tax=Acidibrevibacterium sp. TaxID=2606776 RepID=UPI003D046D8C
VGDRAALLAPSLKTVSQEKVFWFFFSRKNRFLPTLLPPFRAGAFPALAPAAKTPRIRGG